MSFKPTYYRYAAIRMSDPECFGLRVEHHRYAAVAKNTFHRWINGVREEISGEEYLKTMPMMLDFVVRMDPRDPRETGLVFHSVNPDLEAAFIALKTASQTRSAEAEG